MRFTNVLLMIFLVCIALVVSGCTSLDPATPTPKPTFTMVYTSTAAPTPTPTATPIPTPTSTPIPTQVSNGVGDYYNVTIGLTISHNGDILINNSGGPGVGNLMSLTVMFVDRTGTTRGPDTVSNLASYGVSGDLGPDPESSAVIAGADCGYMTHVIVQGTFRDGSAPKTLAEDWLSSGYQ